MPALERSICCKVFSGEMFFSIFIQTRAFQTIPPSIFFNALFSLYTLVLHIQSVWRRERQWKNTGRTIYIYKSEKVPTFSCTMIRTTFSSTKRKGTDRFGQLLRRLCLFSLWVCLLLVWLGLVCFGELLTGSKQKCLLALAFVCYCVLSGWCRRIDCLKVALILAQGLWTCLFRSSATEMCCVLLGLNFCGLSELEIAV